MSSPKQYRSLYNENTYKLQETADSKNILLYNNMQAYNDDDVMVTSSAAKRCCICGGYVNGVGPGLYDTQQKAINDADDVINNNDQISSQLFDVTSLSDVFDDEDEEEDCYPITPLSMFKKSNHFDLARLSMEPKRPPSRKHKKVKRSTTPARRLTNSYDIRTQPRSMEVDRESGKAAALCLYCNTHSDLHQQKQQVKYTYVEKYGVKYQIKVNTDDDPAGMAQQRTSNGARKFNVRDIFLLTRTANVFIYFNGFKPSLTMSATTFRNMARSCQLCDQQSLPSVDILYMDVMRSHNRDRPSSMVQQPGLTFPAFVEALFKLAKFQFRGASLHEKFSLLVSNCDKCIRDNKWCELKAKRRLKNQSLRRKALNTTSPRVSCSSSQRNPYF